MYKKIKSILLAIVFSLASHYSFAKEGMWLPILLKSIEGDMQSMGLRLSAEDIYGINKSSLKDAVISFGGFCTGEIISNQGLILTNHHCGYGEIQYHSSVEKDYLTNGYWAMNHSQELASPNLTATFIVRMEDVSELILDELDALSNEEKNKKIQERIDSLTKASTEGSHYTAYIRPFYYGREYYMFITETYKDVRLVGAPPSAIGKFGGDTDNWMWPRHTGDFSLFRIYADSNNRPAEYAESNVPYTPKHYFPISTSGAKEGDFTMVFGFPGRTEEYLTSTAIRQTKEVINPARIAIREEALRIMDEQMKGSDKVRIQYASKYARVSNYWKKWIGENKGLEASNAIASKKEEEAKYNAAVKGQPKYEGIVEALALEYEAIEKYSLARNYFVEIPYRTVELFYLASRFRKWFDDKEAKEPSSEDLAGMTKQVKSHFKNYDPVTDKLLAESLLEKYRLDMPSDFTPESFLVSSDEFGKMMKSLYKESVFNNEKKMVELIESGDWSKISQLKKDPAYLYMSEFYGIYNDKVKPEYDRISARIDSMNAIYLEGLRMFVPGKYYPDANSTLRLAYGQVENYSKDNGEDYPYFTTAKEIKAKYQPGSDDFDLPPKLLELIENAEYGPYADEDGTLHVCFIASNHTTGGNSGSPVINANGELIGLNFDRNWEGTMSDINYDISLCRNISVDIRYVLFVIDKYAGAANLIDEMKLVAK